MKKQMKRLLIAVLAGILGLSLPACVPVTPGQNMGTTEVPTEKSTEAPTEAQSKPNEPTITFEEMVMREDINYLSGVTYKNFVLSGEKEPYFIGRWFKKDVNNEPHMVTTTDGSHLYFLVEGAEEISVNFTVITSLEKPYFAYSIDGEAPVRQHIDEPIVALPDSERHTVCIIADGMSENENKWRGEIGFALRSIDAGENGRIVGICPTEKVVFFYGDSITEGVRALNMNATADGNSATNAYSWHTAQNLGAVPYLVGYGASGLTREGSFQTMINAVDRLSMTRLVEDSEVANVTPDLIVINHGANDSAFVSTEDFDAALRRVIARLQEKYPGVKIVYCVAFLEAYDAKVQAQGVAIDRLASEIDGMYIVHSKDWALTYTDGNLHPNAAGGKKAGELLAAAIKGLLGEDFFS